MKTLFFIGGLAMLFAACTHSQRVADFIPGIYVNHAESAYSIADDTLVITKDYRITRRTTFRRKGGMPQHKVKNYTAVWDSGKQTLQLTQNGTILMFRPDENKLLIENSEYRKL
jgi:hypothetical protein